MKISILKEKSYKFALRIVKFSIYLNNEKKEFVLSKQVLRSGTSIGAKIEEAYQGESKADFIQKFSIANKEAFETHNWLRILPETGLIDLKLAKSLIMDYEEIKRLPVSSIKTSRENK